MECRPSRGAAADVVNVVARGKIALYVGAVANNREFWRRHPGLVWSNPEAPDAVFIRAALLKARFTELLDIAIEFGLDRLKEEWRVLDEEGTPKARLARAS